jgi:hypothetical protein
MTGGYHLDKWWLPLSSTFLFSIQVFWLNSTNKKQDQEVMTELSFSVNQPKKNLTGDSYIRY